MRIAPVMRALGHRGVAQRLVHRGPSVPTAADARFEDQALPAPDVYLGVRSSGRVEEIAKVMLAFERTLLEPPRAGWVLVPGDADWALAAALTASKMGLRVAHLEAGLRSGRRDPEELNRVAIDHASDLLLTPSPEADAHLAREGIGPERVARVGSALVDALLAALPRARERAVPEQLGLEPDGYAVAALRHPSTLGDQATLARLVGALARLARLLPVVLPVEPDMRAHLAAPELGPSVGRLRIEEPFAYADFLSLLAEARLVLTDWGDVEEETTVLGVPCLTLREATARLVTVEQGTNQVVGTDPDRIAEAAARVLAKPPRGRCPELWDGQAGKRVAHELAARM
jgi:UDP-N-acetylglucosamine 2-epimerase (non-hydrolysing)